jgi:hypothetical protein
MVKAAVALLLAASVAAAREHHVERFGALYEIARDGSVEVTERLRIRFEGGFRGLIRDIPVSQTIAGFGEWDIRLAFLGASGVSKVERSRRGGNLELKLHVPDARDAVREVEIRYRVRNAFRTWNGLDEFYWNVTGHDWENPVESASARWRFPEGIPAGEARVAAWTGAYGSKASEATVRLVDERTLEVAAKGPLRFREGLTVAVGLPLGMLQRPGFGVRAAWFLADNWPVLLPLLPALFFFLLWWFRGRDSLRGRSIVPQWEAPAGARPAETGVLADDRVDRRDLTATVIDLAVRGHLRIEEVGDGHRLVRRDADSSSLRAYESEMLERLFQGKRSVLVSDLEEEFYAVLGPLRDSILAEVVRRGFFARRPDRVNGAWTLAAAGAFAAAFFLAIAAGISSPWFLATLLLGAAVTFVSAAHMTRRTSLGLDALAAVKGLELYLVTAERERMRAMPPDHFERLLPYAIALGVETRWAKKLEGLYREKPDWYVGNYQGAFWPRLQTMHRSLGHAMVSAPRSASSGYSGGSGFSSGGGFSGGGFGGGGGRGF